MPRRVPLAPLLIGLVVALFGAQSAHADDPSLYVRYTMNCTFTIAGDNGGAITVIPPGKYQVWVTSPQGFAEPDLSAAADPNFACGGSLSFRLTGPGVALHTTLEGGDASAEQFQVTFQVGTYVAQEDRRPTVPGLVLTVASGAGSTGAGSSSGPTGGGSGSSTKTGVVTKLTPSTAAVRGTLSGGVSTVGKLTLMFKGKTVSSLKSGRYKITVLDETSKKGFTIQALGKKSTKVTGTTFLGRHSVTLSLKAGQWFYYSPSGKKTYFIVAG